MGPILKAVIGVTALEIGGGVAALGVAARENSLITAAVTGAIAASIIPLMVLSGKARAKTVVAVVTIVTVKMIDTLPNRRTRISDVVKIEKIGTVQALKRDSNTNISSKQTELKSIFFSKKIPERQVLQGERTSKIKKKHTAERIRENERPKFLKDFQHAEQQIQAALVAGAKKRAINTTCENMLQEVCRELLEELAEKILLVKQEECALEETVQVLKNVQLELAERTEQAKKTVTRIVPAITFPLVLISGTISEIGLVGLLTAAAMLVVVETSEIIIAEKAKLVLTTAEQLAELRKAEELASQTEKLSKLLKIVLKITQISESEIAGVNTLNLGVVLESAKRKIIFTLLLTSFTGASLGLVKVLEWKIDPISTLVLVFTPGILIAGEELGTLVGLI